MRWVTHHTVTVEEEQRQHIVVYAPGEQVDSEKVLGRARYTIDEDKEVEI